MDRLAEETDTGNEGRLGEIERRLLEARKVFLWGPVDEAAARGVVARLTLLEAEDSNREIVLYVNSPGGTMHDGLAIYDAIQAVSCSVCTVTVGLAASAGSLVQACGTRGRRFSWPHARLMIHQPLIMGQYTGPASDVEIQAREYLASRELLNELLAEHSGQPLEKVARDTDRNFWMSAAEAQEYGFIDDIITSMTPPPLSEG